MSDQLTALLLEHETWLTVERGLATNSLAAYRRDLRRYERYLRRHGLADANAVREETVSGYVEYLKRARDAEGDPRFAPASIARALVAVRSFHRFCVDEGLVDQDPSEEVGAPRVPQGLPKALTEAEVEALLAAVEGDDPRAQRDRAILETLYATGVRISELVGLDRADLDLEDGLVRVLGKGSKERVVPVGRTARQRDRRLPRPRAPGAGAAGDPAGAGRSAAAERPRRAAVPAELLDDRDRGGGAGRARRPALAPRAAALVRDPHARARRRHPGGAGAPGPRQPVDDAGVHEGLAGAIAGGLRARASPGNGRGSCARRRRVGAGRWRRTPTGHVGFGGSEGPRRPGGRLSAHVGDPVLPAARRVDRRAGPPHHPAPATRPRAGTTDLDFDEGFADSGQVTAERGEVDALAGSLSENLAEIEAALAKLEQGTLRPVRGLRATRSRRPASRRCPRRASASPVRPRPTEAHPAGSAGDRALRPALLHVAVESAARRGRRGLGGHARHAGGARAPRPALEPGPPAPDRQRPAGRGRARARRRIRSGPAPRCCTTSASTTPTSGCSADRWRRSPPTASAAPGSGAGPTEPGSAGRIGRYERHGEIGADELRAVGSPEPVAEWSALHHHPGRVRDARRIPAGELAVLDAADH